jgi:hypothetical protein
VALAGINNQFRTNADERNFEQQKEFYGLQSGDKVVNTSNGLFQKGEDGYQLVPGSQKEAVPPRPIVIPGVGGFDAITREAIPGMQIQPKGASQSDAFKSQIAQINARRAPLAETISGLNTEYRNLTSELDKTDDASRKDYIVGRLGAIWKEIDLNRNALKGLEAEAAKLAPPTNSPMAMPTQSMDPMGDTLPVPDVLPARGAIPQTAPTFVPGKVYKDKAGNRRVYDGQNFNPLP